MDIDEPHRPGSIDQHPNNSIQPGRRCRSRRLTMARGWASLALKPANFSASWLNPDRASCAASAAISSDTILSITPESWFDSTVVACISAGLNVANGTTLEPFRPAAQESMEAPRYSPPPQRRYARPRGLTARTSITRSASRRSKITLHSPTRNRHKRSAPRSSLTSPSGSTPIAALIRSRSRRPSRRRDFSAAGRISIRHPCGSASAQLRLDLRPRDTGLVPRLPNGPQILLADFLVVIRHCVELGDNRVLGTAKQDRSRGQRLIRKGIHQLVQLGLGHTGNRSSGHLNAVARSAHIGPWRLG